MSLQILPSDESCVDDDKKKTILEKITELTGLDYEQFLRSVMLAQGQFTRFLKAKDKERAEILEKITGTEIYSELSQAAHERAIEEQKKYDQARKAYKSASWAISSEKETMTLPTINSLFSKEHKY